MQRLQPRCRDGQHVVRDRGDGQPLDGMLQMQLVPCGTIQPRKQPGDIAFLGQVDAGAEQVDRTRDPCRDLFVA
ncbi:hypothetical protein D3C81_1591820 [compost metagenome]